MKLLINMESKEYRSFILQSNGLAEVTDDTQMTLFTAEGLLWAETRGIRRGICHEISVIYNAYQRVVIYTRLS